MPVKTKCISYFSTLFFSYGLHFSVSLVFLIEVRFTSLFIILMKQNATFSPMSAPLINEYKLGTAVRRMFTTATGGLQQSYIQVCFTFLTVWFWLCLWDWHLFR
jgi:hypothetical protein